MTPEIENEYQIAYMIAKNGHSGQFRHDNITPYFNHPLTVAMLVPEYGVVAILHDLLEDNKNITAQFLLDQGISKENVEAVVALTHEKSEPYIDYLKRVKENPIALAVKIADICHNLSDSPSRKQVIKYLNALAFLKLDENYF